MSVRYGAPAPQPSIVSSNDAPTEAEEPLSVETRMKIQQEMVKRMLERPWSYEPVPLWYRDLGASERRVKELLSVSESFDPIWVDGCQGKTAFFDESEKLVPTPKKRVWYHQTPQILGRTYGFIFKPEAGQ